MIKQDWERLLLVFLFVQGKEIMKYYVSRFYYTYFYGSTGATIKDTRTKSRGRVEAGEGGGIGWGGVEGWGENADKCN